MKSYRKTTIRSIVCIICIFAAGGLFANEAAAQRTVCASGCNHTTIAAAITAAAAGDTIEVRDATHTENNITLNKSLTIQGQTGTKVVIQAAAAAGSSSGRIFSMNSGTETVTIRNLTLRYGDEDDDNGGAILLQNGTMTLRKVTITQNEAEWGAGIAITGGTMTLENVTLYNNTSASNAESNENGNGGIYISGGVLTLRNCTITGNVANKSGGVDGLEISAGTVNMYNTIIANRAVGVGDDCSGSLNTNTNNLVEDGTCSPAVTGDPLLGTFNYYDDDSTPAVNADTQTFSLQSSSPAIDVGDNTSCLSDDQRSYARPVDGDGDTTATCDIGAYEYTGAVVVTCTGSPPPLPTAPALGRTDFGSHSYPTFLFVASYDWLHNFYDRNADGRTGGSKTDPDTDNFNKIIALDSNLFPIMTAVYGDHEFPNITARNALTWDSVAASSYSPSINDYLNRSLAVAPDFIAQKTLTYSNLTAECVAGNWEIMDTSEDKEIYQYGARSFMQWAFVTDPGNSNIRRYEFQKLGGYYGLFDAEGGIGGIVTAPPPGEAYDITNCYDCTGSSDCDPDYGGDPQSAACNPPSDCSHTCPKDTWFTGDTDIVIDPSSYGQVLHTNLGGSCDPNSTPPPPDGCYENDTVYWMYMHGPSFQGNCSIDNLSELNQYIDGTGNWDGSTCPNSGYQYLEIIWDFSEYTDVQFPVNNFPLKICGNSRAAQSDVLAVGINTDPSDPQDAAWAVNYTQQIKGSPGSPNEFGHLTASSHRECYTYYFNIDASYDIDSSTPGVQIRFRVYSLKQGGFVLDGIEVGDRDSAFAVKYGGSKANIESRWANLTSYLETIPPDSYPGYTTFKHANMRTVGYGYRTNTSFTTARNVRFKDPRDVDVYRDMFDENNGGPVYTFVADTMNSRIQVFMNATGSAGTTNASFPIRPVRVAKRAGVWSDSPFTEYKSNELAMRIHTGINNTAVAFGDGRKADWRHYTTANGTTLETIPALAGRGEFFYPHGVAVDQDPNTKDVYLFVADTFNHRIQVFRDSTGVSFQPINNKRFDFRFEEGWGTYPANNTTIPGPYNFKYPKGLDIVRFSHNSSILYVVDSKNYRLLKYLITENDSGGISSIDVQAGYGYKGGTFVRNLTSMRGDPLTAHRSFEEMAAGGADGMRAVGFWNPQDVATGYSGFYMYSAPNVGGYPYEVYTTSGGTTRTRGVQFLNNYMIYVTDYARNNTTITTDRLNMRVMQFLEPPQRNFTSFLPWRTETVTFDKGELGQSVFGVYSGSYASTGTITAATNTLEGSTNNVPGRSGYFTDRPVGIAAVTWDTVSPFDMRVVNLNSTPRALYPSGATIARGTELQVGVRSRGFFGLPYTNVSSYTNYTAERMTLDGSKVKRVHVFCYNTNGVYQNHTALVEVPFKFTPGTSATGGGLGCPAGYMKIIAEDKHFGYSGKTGTMIFRLTN